MRNLCGVLVDLLHWNGDSWSKHELAMQYGPLELWVSPNGHIWIGEGGTRTILRKVP